jgi:hypothetical protein
MTLTLDLAISFQTAFAGAKSIFMEVENATADSGLVKIRHLDCAVGMQLQERRQIDQLTIRNSPQEQSRGSQ